PACGDAAGEHHGGTQSRRGAGGGAVPGRHADQRADVELPAAAAGHVAGHRSHGALDRRLSDGLLRRDVRTGGDARRVGARRPPGRRTARRAMELVFSQLVAMLHALWWPFCRVLAMFSAAAVLGEASVPVPVRVLLSLVMAVVLLPVAQPAVYIDP